MNIGIDLGTSYSSVAAEVNGKIEMIRVSTGASAFGDSYSIPTAVYIENGEILLGQVALNKRKISPSCFKDEFKRDLGTTTPYVLGGEEYLPEQLYTEFFLYFKKQAADQIGERIEKAYITHPANYGNNKKRLIEKAANNAGLFDVVLVDEPTAAAAGYAQKNKIIDGDILLVYDLGGGTFDAALIKKTSRGYVHLTEPLGISQCGGVDFDRAIFDDIVSKLGKSGGFNMDHIMREKRFTASLSEICIQIKHQLSQAQSHTEPIAVGFDYFDYTITRREFEGMIHPYVVNTCEKVKDILKNSGLTVSDIDKVLLVGGSSRVPLVQSMLCEVLKKEASYDADPELAVCQGAVSIGIDQQKEDMADRNEKVAVKEELPQSVNSYDEKYNRMGTNIEEKKEINQSRMGVNTTQTWDILQRMKEEETRRHELEGQKIDELMRKANERWNQYDEHEKNKTINNGKTATFKDEVKLPESKVTERPERMKQLMDDVISGFNTCDGEWIYYGENDNTNHSYGLYRIKIDGTRKARLCAKGSELGVHVRSDSVWVYYQVKANNQDRGELYRIRKDGSGEARILNEFTYHYNLGYRLSGGWIYFSDSDIHLKKMHPDGSYITTLISDMCPLLINVEKDWVYYKSYDNCLSRISINGTFRKNIFKTSFKIDQIHIIGDWIYYVTKNTEEKGNGKTDIYDLWKVCADGTGSAKVSSDFCRGNIRIIDNLIYYFDKNRELFRMKLDRTNTQRVSPEMLKQVLLSMK